MRGLEVMSGERVNGVPLHLMQRSYMMRFGARGTGLVVEAATETAIEMAIYVLG